MRKAAIVVISLTALSMCPSVSQAGSGVVALQTADASCPDDSGAIYVDCGNGTVTDNRTGLVWLKNADCLSNGVDWFTAMEVVEGLSDLQGSDPDDCGLSDGSSPGEWRLPSKGEWEAMIADAVALGCVFGEIGGPSITNDSGAGCWQEGPESSFSGVQTSFYWSSSSLIADPVIGVWGTSLYDGSDSPILKTADLDVWPVRGGQ